MNFLTPDDLNALIELVETNNQYNDDDDKEFWDDVLIRLNQTSRHCLDVWQLPKWHNPPCGSSHSVPY